jgi:hypothetical protein
MGIICIRDHKVWETDAIREGAIKRQRHGPKPLISDDAFELFSQSTRFESWMGNWLGSARTVIFNISLSPSTETPGQNNQVKLPLCLTN